MKPDFENQVMNLFECPVCYNYMSPPIMLCTGGHIICSGCYDKINACPQCRKPKSVARPAILEAVYNELEFPCRYATNGCNMQGNGNSMKTHERTCEFTTWPCLLRHYGVCKWQGAKNTIIRHMKQKHKESIYCTNESVFVSHNMSTNSPNRKPVVVAFHAFDTFFRAFWAFDRDTSDMRLSVNVLDKNVRHGQFSFQLTVYQEDTSFEVISLRSVCLYLSDDDVRFERNNYVSLEHEMIRRNCDDTGNLFYKVGIYKNNMGHKAASYEQSFQDNCVSEVSILLANTVL